MRTTLDTQEILRPRPKQYYIQFEYWDGYRWLRDDTDIQYFDDRGDAINKAQELNNELNSDKIGWMVY